MSINDEKLAADIELSKHAANQRAERFLATSQKPELTLSELLTQRSVQFANSPKAVEIIDQGIEKLFKELVSDAFRSYGDFGKQLTDAMKAALPTNINDVIDLPKYNHMVIAQMREA